TRTRGRGSRAASVVAGEGNERWRLLEMGRWRSTTPTRSPDKNGTSLVWVGLAPATGSAPKHNVDTSHFLKEN
ncbi:hypothetical protein NDU88_006168, partial [Pleurodeles waltl]